MNHSQLLDRYPIISDQIGYKALGVVLRELEHTLDAGITGDVAEFGCYIGTTSLFIRRLLDARGQSGVRQFHAYDSFAGLPAKTVHDDSTAGLAFTSGALQVSKKQFLQTFRKAVLVPPIVHKAWFQDLTPDDLPSTIAFAFLDGDFYESILASLQLVWPRLTSGGTITVDDDQREALPGVSRAIETFLADKVAGVRSEQHIAIIKKS